MEAGKICLFIVSLSLGLLFSYLCYRMVAEVNLRLPESKRLAILRGAFVIFILHRREFPKSRLRLKAMLCLVVAFILFILSADAVL
jgi:hypothetical protein